jgi:hypothetical protein
MGAMAGGRTIRKIKDGYELRESQASYNGIFAPENCAIDTNKT